MFSRMSRTWEMTKEAFAVLAADKRLMIFPILSGIAVILVSASFAIPVVMSGMLAPQSTTSQGTQYLLYFLFYFVNYFVVIFFNCALVGAASMCLAGGHATVRDGLSMAWQRIGRIFVWAVVAATVGFIIRMIEERVEKVGRIIAWLLGTAWTLMTYFMIPVLMFEDQGLIDSVKRSTRVLKDTWGEEVLSGFSFGLIYLLALIPIAIVTYAAFMINMLLGVAVALFMLLMLAVVSAAVQGIFTVALYRYATQRQVPQGFTPEMVQGAFISQG